MEKNTDAVLEVIELEEDNTENYITVTQCSKTNS